MCGVGGSFRQTDMTSLEADLQKQMLPKDWTVQRPFHCSPHCHDSSNWPIMPSHLKVDRSHRLAESTMMQCNAMHVQPATVWTSVQHVTLQPDALKSLL